MSKSETTKTLIALSHELGAERRELAILGEGNTSAKLSEESFLVKASGSTLGTLTEADIVECRFGPLLALLRQEDFTDQQIEDELLGCRVDSTAKKPSVEALFHAWLLGLPGVRFVGHTHSIAINRILCSGCARDFATHRLFPDEIVCCGPESVFVGYTDPGLRLAQVIAREVQLFMKDSGAAPRVILLQNHGVITLGASPDSVKAAMFMADKSARIFAGATALGGARFLSAANVDRIAGRLDEHYRQRALNL